MANEKMITLESLRSLTNIIDQRYPNRLEKHAPNGIAELDEDGFIYSDQIRTTYSKTWFYATMSDFPAVGNTDDIYIAFDTDKVYKFDAETMTYVERGEPSDEEEAPTNGKSAFEIANEVRESNGDTPFATEADWLASLKGQDGSDGTDGKSAFEIANEVRVAGGDTAFASESDWLNSLKGKDGTAASFTASTVATASDLPDPGDFSTIYQVTDENKKYRYHTVDGKGEYFLCDDQGNQIFDSDDFASESDIEALFSPLS